MASIAGFDPALATVALLALNGVVPLPRAAVCIPAGAALGWMAIGPAMVGTTFGFALGFALARFALRRPVERHAFRRPALAAVMRALDQEGWHVLALLRFASPVPGPVINAACGVTRMGFGTFLVVGLMAVLPQTLLYVYLGLAGRSALASPSVFSLDALTAIVGIVLAIVALWRIRVAVKRHTARLSIGTGKPAV